MNGKIDCIICKNTNCFIKICPPKYINEISKVKTQNWYKKGENIFKEGDPIFGIYFVHTGGVKIVTTSVVGREQIVRLAGVGDIVGFRGIKSDKYYFNAIALMDSFVCFFKNETFEKICQDNPKFTYQLMLFFAYSLRVTELRVKYQSMMNIREKVAEAFIYFYEMFGVNPETKSLNIELSRKDIANTAGTTPEQVTRQLRDFEEEKIISREKRAIQMLSINKLKLIINNFKRE